MNMVRRQSKVQDYSRTLNTGFCPALATLLIITLMTTSVQSRPFLDLAIGAHLDDWPDGTGNVDRHLGDDNPIFVGRLGWQTRHYDFVWGSNIQFQVFWEHGSSVSDGKDTGFDLFMGGIRIE